MGSKWTFNITVGLCIICIFRDGVGGVLLCDQGKALECAEKADEKAYTVGCNWKQVMPDLTTCVNYYVKGCYYAEIQQWDTYLSNFNDSLQTQARDGRCNRDCAVEATEKAAVEKCATASPTYDDLLKKLEMDGLAGENVTGTCNEIAKKIECMEKAATTCTGSISYKNDQVARFDPLKKYCTSIETTDIEVPEPYNYTLLAIVFGVIAFIIGLNLVLVLLYCYNRRQRLARKANMQTHGNLQTHVSPTTYYQQPPLGY